MVGLEPMVEDGRLLTHKKAAGLLEISVRTLRNYEKQGLIPPGRPKDKYKYYYGRDVKRCWKNYFKNEAFF